MPKRQTFLNKAISHQYPFKIGGFCVRTLGRCEQQHIIASIIHVPHQGCRLHGRDKASRLRNSGQQGDANGSHHRDEQGVIEYREPCRQSRVKDRPRAQSSETRQRHILCLGAPQGHEPNEALLGPNQVRSACQSGKVVADQHRAPNGYEKARPMLYVDRAGQRELLPPALQASSIG